MFMGFNNADCSNLTSHGFPDQMLDFSMNVFGVDGGSWRKLKNKLIDRLEKLNSKVTVYPQRSGEELIYCSADKHNNSIVRGFLQNKT
jgi:hypothetical protein